MIEQDTIRLLRECDAGVKMGIASIDDILDRVDSNELKEYLSRCKREHVAIFSDMERLLDEYGDEGKEPNPMAKGMSWMKTETKIAIEDSDRTIADLMTDGCNMGVKSLTKYLHQYQAANEKSKKLAQRLIDLEERMAEDIRKFL